MYVCDYDYEINHTASNLEHKLHIPSYVQVKEHNCEAVIFVFSSVSNSSFDSGAKALQLLLSLQQKKLLTSSHVTVWMAAVTANQVEACVLLPGKHEMDLCMERSITQTYK